jgi:hypothetical protein
MTGGRPPSGRTAARQAGTTPAAGGVLTVERIAIGGWLVAMALALAGALLLAATLTTPVPGVWAFRGFSIAIGLACATVGVVVIARVPGNPIGWLFMVSGLLGSLQGAAAEYAVMGILAAPGGVPAPELAAWLAGWLWIPAMSTMLAFLPLVFPSGHLPSARWRPLAWFDAGCALLASLGAMFLPGRLDNAAYVDNPFALLSAFPGEQRWVGYLPLIAAIAAGGVTLVLAFRRSGGIERQQLKWLAFSAALAGAALLLIPLGQSGIGFLPGWASKVAQILVVAGILGIPIAAGTAILRYRLWDIDRIISRTLAYALVTGLLAGLFAGMVLVIQAALSSATNANSFAVAASTLVVFALFQPVRGRVQRLVDRRFNRARVDAEAAVSALASQLRDETDLELVGGTVERVIGQALAPAHLAIWTRDL